MLVLHSLEITVGLTSTAITLKVFLFQILYENVFCICTLFHTAKVIENSIQNTILKSNLYFVNENI